jgi:protein pelota
LRILKEDLKHGAIEIRVECEDDLWTLKSVIMKGDLVIAKTLRDVKIDGEGKRRLPMILAVRVQEVYFQPFSGRLRVHGRIEEGPDGYGLRGSYHTLNIDVGSELAIVKPKWTEEQLSRLKKASTRRLRVLLAAFDFDELAVAMVFEQGIKYLAEKSLEGIRDDGPPIEDLARKIAEIVIDAAKKENPDVVIVASPAFLKDMVAEIAGGRLEKPVIVDSVSSGGKHGIVELVRRDAFKNILRTHNVLVVEEVFEEFLKLVSTGSEKVAYGLNTVKALAKQGAISKLLVSEDMLYSEMAEEVTEIMNYVESKGGEVRLVPEETPTFSKVKAFGGLVAILKYSVDYQEIQNSSLP